MKGVGRIQALITAFKSKRIRGRWRKPFSKKRIEKGGTVLRWKKSSPEILKNIRSKIRKQRRIENLMYTSVYIGALIGLFCIYL